MLEINRTAEVALHARAADIEFTLVHSGPKGWTMVVEGVTDVRLADTTGLTEGTARQEFALDDTQAAATVALFVAGDNLPDKLALELYMYAEQVWKGVPTHFRPIP